MVYLFALVAMALSACEDKEIKVSNSGPKLVLGGIFFADSILQVDITRNLPVDSNRVNAEVQLKNAQVNIYLEGQEVAQLDYVTPVIPEEEEFYNPRFSRWSNSAYRSTSDFIPEEGKEYEIVINAEGFTETVAHTKIPEKVEIKDMQYSWEPEVVDIDHHPIGGTIISHGVPFSISFQDSPDTEDYYKIQCFRIQNLDYVRHYSGDLEDEHIVAENLYQEQIRPKTSVNENLLEENPFTFQQEILLSDKFFNGDLHTVDFYLSWSEYPSWDGEGFETTRPGMKIHNSEYRTGYTYEILYVTLKHITRDQYLYEVTLEEQILTFGDTFSEPVFIHTNVENGLGIFAGYSMTKSEDITE